MYGSYELDPKSWKMIKKNLLILYVLKILYFWKDRKNACYATLIKIKNPVTFEPFEVEKRDRRGWVVCAQKMNNN